MESQRSQTARIIGEFCEHLKRIGVDVQQVILFGSHVRGEAHEDSDIDLLIVSSDFAPLEDLERRRLLSRARLNLWQAIHAYPVSPEELERVEPATLLEEILATGRPVDTSVSLLHHYPHEDCIGSEKSGEATARPWWGDT